VSSQAPPSPDRRARLDRARLYFVTDLRPDLGPLLRAALAGGVDMVQLRDKRASDEELLAAAAEARAACDEHGVLLWLNDRPGLALAAGVDGVHVGQDDDPVADVRRAVGPDVLVGLSTHSPEQLEAALASDADQLSVGPVWETPTKEGRPAAGLEYVRHAARRAGRDRAWFAIGGIDASNIGEVVAAGAERVVVVRAIRDADDPRAAAAELRAALEGARLAQGGRHRKRRRSERARAVPVSTPAQQPATERAQRTAAGAAQAPGERSPQPRGYARSRAKDAEARARLEPLAPGERPVAVTIGALAAAGLAIANLVAMIARYDPDEPGKTAGTALVTGILVLIAAGMWKAKYWAVLGMQTLLALTIVGAAVGSLTALNANAAILIVAILVPAVTLFWFLVKAMARIQMPTRPGA
jgi:thiamine-phosphate pyrophosphorylase